MHRGVVSFPDCSYGLSLHPRLPSLHALVILVFHVNADILYLENAKERPFCF